MYSSGMQSIVHVSAPTSEFAKGLAHEILQLDLAIGISVLPTVTTLYKWKGEVLEDSEALMVVKTHSAKVDDLVNYINSITASPDSVGNEAIAFKIEHDHISYYNWIADRIPENSELLSRMIDNQQDKLPETKEETEEKEDNEEEEKEEEEEEENCT